MSDDGDDVIRIETADADAPTPSFTPWEQRVVSAIQVAEAAKVGVVILRVVAAISVLASIVGLVLLVFVTDDSGGFVSEASSRQQWGQFLQSVASPLAFAGIVFGLSYIVQIAAARLDVDIVMADADETGSGPGE